MRIDYPEGLRVLGTDVSAPGEWGHSDRVTVQPREVVTAASVCKGSQGNAHSS